MVDGEWRMGGIMSKTKLAFGVEPADRIYRLRLARYQAMAETIADYISRKEEKNKLDLLDIGVGSGRSMRYIEGIGAADRIRFSGVDLKLRRLDSVYSPHKWDLKQCDVEQGLPFKPASFDIVVSEQLLEHLNKPEVVISEAARVLRPGGLFILGVPVFPPGISCIRRLIGGIRKLLNVKDKHIQAFSCAAVKHLVRACGCFEIVDIRGFRMFSGGILRRLEDMRWWYRLNRLAGKLVPGICTEVQIVARKTEG